MAKRKNRKKKYLKIGNVKIKKNVAITISCILTVIIAFVLFRTSDYWPWPSQSEIDQRLIDVIDACIYNENSRACKNLQGRYKMDFEYCYALSDIPEIGTLMPVYGVAKKEGFVGSPLSWESRNQLKGYSSNDLSPDNNIKNTKKNSSVYPYYGCTDSLDKIKKQKGSSLIAKPTTIALFGLSKIPRYYETYKPEGRYGCIFHYASINNLWGQIPNISIIKNEAENIFKTYPKCSMKTEINRAIDKLNNKLKNYANNYSVQLFFQKYDEWNMSTTYTCEWYDKEFKQYCGAGSEGSNESTEHNTMIKGFTEEMYKYLHTEYFTSKVVVTD